MTRAIGAGLERRINSWVARILIPKDVRHHFNNRVSFWKSLETTKQGIAVSRSKPIIQEWKELIAVARRKEKGEVTNLEERIQKADDKFKKTWI